MEITANKSEAREVYGNKIAVDFIELTNFMTFSTSTLERKEYL